jgi:hypothetical protein
MTHVLKSADKTFREIPNASGRGLAEYVKFFPTDPPTRAVAKLGVELPNLLVSIKMTAAC